MSADKHPAEVLADVDVWAYKADLMPVGESIEAWIADARAELRRIRVLEDQRDAANEAANGMHAMVCAEVEKVKALEAERDQLRAEVEALRADKDRIDWLADPENAIGNVQLPREVVEANLHSLRDAIDSARKATP